jgi:glutamyl-tRNA reductase
LESAALKATDETPGAQNRAMKLFVAGLSYKTAPVEVREKLAIAPARLRCLGCRLKVGGGLSELVLVSTCNRVEIYGVSSWAEGQVQRLFQQLSDSDFDFTPHLYVKHGEAAARHLFAVASGLDSMVLGETEITGQVKQAYQAACEARLTGRITNKLFQAALSVAKTIRTDTQIGRGATSVGSVAVELAERIFDGDLSTKTVMIVGAGKMGEACVRHLAKKGAKSVLVLNRSLERAEALAVQFGGQALPLDQLSAALVRADIVVSSTGAPNTILGRNDLTGVMPLRRNRPVFLIDIAVPRDIAPEVEELNNVYLYNVDHLEEIVRENVKQREKELSRCEAIIAERAAELNARWAAVPPPKREPAIIKTGWTLAGMIDGSANLAHAK